MSSLKSNALVVVTATNLNIFFCPLLFYLRAINQLEEYYMALPIMKDINDEGEGIAYYSPIKRDGQIISDGVYFIIDIGEEKLTDAIIN